MALPTLRPQDLEGKVAVVTGASRGIGRAISMNLASRGCSILGTCSSSTNVPLIHSISQELSSLSSSSPHTAPNILGISANILSPTCASTIADTLASHFNSKIDIFINNAGDSRIGVSRHPGLRDRERSPLPARKRAWRNL